MNRIDFNQWTSPSNPKRVELIFETRHKAYGAYALRTQYDRTLIRAFVITVVSILSLFLVPFIKQLFANDLPPINVQGQSDSLVMVEVIIKPTVKPKLAITRSKSGTKRSKIKFYQMSDDTTDKDTSQLVKEPFNPEPGPSGDSDSSDTPYLPGDAHGGDQIISPKIKQEKEIIETYVDLMPEYNGGLNALYEFLGSELQIPENALTDGVSAKVMVNFVVEKDGSISNVKILGCSEKGYGFEGEAIRAISKMPNWKPGRQRGKPVRVYFNLPIQFTTR